MVEGLGFGFDTHISELRLERVGFELGESGGWCGVQGGLVIRDYYDSRGQKIAVLFGEIGGFGVEVPANLLVDFIDLLGLDKVFEEGVGNLPEEANIRYVWLIGFAFILP